MNPNAAEPGNQGGVQAPINNTSPDSLSNLQGVVVDAAKEAAAVQTPKDQFANQFSEPASPPVAETPASGLIDTALSSLGTAPPASDASDVQPSTDNLAPEQTQPVVETLAQPEPEQTPVSALVTKITDAIEEFKEVTKEKVTA